MSDTPPPAHRAAELRALLVVALPIIASNLANMGLGLTDTYIVGKIGKEAVAAVGLGSNIFFGISWTIGAVLVPLDTMLSQARGAGDFDRIKQHFYTGLWMCLGLAPIAALVAWSAVGLASAFGVHPDLVTPVQTYVRVCTIGALPMMLFICATKVLQALERTRMLLLVAIAGNVANYVLTQWMVFGGFGLSAMGVLGAALATSLVRWLMAFALVLLAWRLTHEHHRAAKHRDEQSDAEPRLGLGLGLGLGRRGLGHLAQSLRASFNTASAGTGELLRLGLPAAGQVAAEVGIFTAAGVVIAGFDAAQSAAHQILLQLASTSFMVPLGISIAGAVRVGHAMGAGRPDQAIERGRLALYSGVVFMAASGLVFWLADAALARAFVQDSAVVASFITIVPFAAAFQIFDGTQVVLTGVLRGLGDTSAAAWANFVGYWVIGMPIGAWLARAGIVPGARGVWLGLTIGLVLVALKLLWTFARLARVLVTQGARPAQVGTESAKS